jgi:hypothetical protein
MKRSAFLTSLVDISTAPLLSFKKDELKDVPIKKATLTTGEKKEPWIIRDSYRMSAEQVEGLRDGELEYKEKWLEDQQMQRIMHHIKHCPYLIKKKIFNPDGSVEYHYLLSILPR